MDSFRCLWSNFFYILKWLWILHHIYWWFLKKYLDILLESKEWSVWEIKEFKALIENISDKKIKTLWSDNGGEYTSKEFEAFCKDAGIKRELTTPYNPQQNGVAERKNRTIMEAVKTMIYDQDLPMHLWAEAARTAVYVHNRISHSALGLMHYFLRLEVWQSSQGSFSTRQSMQ